MSNIKKSFTKKQQAEMISRLYELSNSLYKTDTDLDEKINRFVYEEERELLDNFARANDNNLDTVESVQDVVSIYVDELQNMPVISITLPYRPSFHNKLELVDFFDTRMQEGIVLEILLDESLMGGPIIEYKGNHLDYSIKEVVDKVFVVQKANE